jgi:hypothetical protein
MLVLFDHSREREGWEKAAKALCPTDVAEARPNVSSDRKPTLQRRVVGREGLDFGHEDASAIPPSCHPRSRYEVRPMI